MIVSRRRHLVSSSYLINGETIKSVTTKKDLGVTLCHDLCFNLHMENTVQSAFRVLGFIMRTLRPTHDIDSHILLFQSLVLSKLIYASVVWMPFTADKISQIESVQASFCRRLFAKLNGFYPAYPNQIAHTTLREQRGNCSTGSQRPAWYVRRLQTGSSPDFELIGAHEG
uniref:Reverse transcriptase domain-containing protein n=1 Tax=Cacopsylla melanoneura TaxID=428564 RepID=A0A8D9AF90_9HEMI